MTNNELLKSTMQINEGIKKYGDVSFTAGEVVSMIRNLSLEITESTVAGNKEVLAVVTSYALTLMEMILEIAKDVKESESKGGKA